jgi:hypothetical protein
MWLLFATGPAALYVLHRLYVVEWYRWRHGYYHVHEAVDLLQSPDDAVRWRALDKVCNVRYPMPAYTHACECVTLKMRRHKLLKERGSSRSEHIFPRKSYCAQNAALGQPAVHTAARRHRMATTTNTRNTTNKSSMLGANLYCQALHIGIKAQPGCARVK